MVCVFPTIFPATMIVAPNSPIDRINPIKIPPRIPLYARGIVIVSITLILLAPKVLAHDSSFSSIEFIETMIVLTIRGNDVIAAAIAAACHVKIMSIPKVIFKKSDKGDLFPSICSKKKPIATGGIAKGKEIIISSMIFPGSFVLVIIRALIIAGITFNIVAVSYTHLTLPTKA